jgi:hypothetical protein
VGNVAATIRQCLGISPVMPFSAAWHGEFNAIGLQGREMPGMARWTTMGLWTTVFVVVKIQGNGGLNAREANQQQ